MTYLESPALPSCTPPHTPPNDYMLMERIQTLEALVRQQAEEMRKLHLWNEQQARTIAALLAKQKEMP